ncbi:MAG: M20/M25/M40 family metallo-hydrolase [Candidatus Nitrosoabyssus spongiisocia]|nr:MAG: M20/M25/M40 family metallo-hydrolase [Nitrosopumilaceae archaeon AB1(1)]
MTIIITPKYATKILEKAVCLYTPSLHELPMAQYLEDLCDDMGFENIHIDDVGNLIATKGSGSPRILLCGHMDTVPGKINVRQEGDFLYGRGSSDAKAPLMAMLCAANSAVLNGGTVIFAGVVDEEGNALGIKNLVKQDLKIDYAIFGEPSGLNQITIGYKGRFAIKLTTSSKDSCHATAPWLTTNAIQESMIHAENIKKALESGQEDKSKGMLLTATITEIVGGTSHNVTPQECNVTIDIRIPIGKSCKTVNDIIDKYISTINDASTSVSYSILDETEPFETNTDSVLIRAMNLGIFHVLKKRPSLIRKTGTGDMNILGNVLEIPVVTYGPGDSHSSHTIDERVSISQYIKGIEVLSAILKKIKMVHDKS